MAVRAEQQKREAIAAAVGLAAARLGTGRAPSVQRFVEQFYDHVSPADLVERAPEDLYGAALSLWQFAQTRLPGQAKLRVFIPRVEEQGWHSIRTVVEIVNDDMPFLVDSVTAALNGEGVTVHLVIHPILRVERDGEGRLVALADGRLPGQGSGESFMHVEISEVSDAERRAAIAAKLEAVLGEVRCAVEDWPKMRNMLDGLRRDLAQNPPAILPEELTETLDFLVWLNDDNFTFLGYREYRFDARQGTGGPGTVAGGLGILRDEAYRVFEGLRHFAGLSPEVQAFLREPRLLIVSKSNRRASVHRAVRMDAIGVKLFGAAGEVLGIRLFLGLFTSHAYGRSPRDIPFLRRKVRRVMERSGFDPASHDGKTLLHILETFPRDELFQISESELLDFAQGVLSLQERQRIALFVRRDPFGRFASCFIYVPRERYDTALRQRFAAILEAAFAAKVDSFNTQLDDAALARIHFILRAEAGAVAEIDLAAIERRLTEAGRSWADKLSETLVAAKGEEAGLELLSRYGQAFPTAYRERTAAPAALFDIDRIEEVRGGLPLALALYKPLEAEIGELRLKIYRAGSPVALSEILPVIEHMGLKAITEVPYQIGFGGKSSDVWIQDFGLVSPLGDIDIAADHKRFEQAFARVWAGEMESDGLNRLVLAAGLDWRQVTVLRLYAKAMRQAGSAFSQAYMEDALSHYPAIAAQLVALFESRFDPALAASAARETARRGGEIRLDLDKVAGLDEDRILRGFLQVIEKSLRTNFYQRQKDGNPKPYLAVKLASSEIDLLPLPRPLCEIYVYSPRMEGIHLRAGRVARGGIRWSDRKEDFRTEILGLMKAQVAKNAVIVPTGSKGGFVVKRPPPARDALSDEVVFCYATLMRGLLDLTDNIVGDKVLPPEDVVRHDGDDPYLVVAADKGTATFSDIANGISAEYGFWLGDAFASGGSAGWDHKAIGITARGAWETVKRHFRELGRDIQTADFTCAGVGDMAGDVFGNGMLRSPHTKLVACFNHQHIFLDPDPDPAKSLAERRRLFNLPRSSWADYDRAVLSPGGGIFERSAKSIDLSPEIRACLDLRVEQMTPAELIQAILKAPVDLLWFGGIGTFVKASSESHGDAGDRANDVIRVDAKDVRAHVIGEGANLSITQRGRIEYAAKGGRINNDAIDNSAGVDTSDHEVNIKILLNAVVAAGDMTVKQRNELLQLMTDEVAELVLRDNYLQGLALSLAEAQGIERFDQEARLIRDLERAGRLDRAIEFLPNDEALALRAQSHQNLTRPELAVLLAYVKIALTDDLLDSDLPEDPQLAEDLFAYFPRILVERFRAQIESHRLRRELIATVAANDIVNRAGICFVREMCERAGRGPGEVARAYMIVRQVFDFDSLWAEVNALDNKVPAVLQIEMLRAGLRLMERVTAWFLRSPKLDIRAQVAAFRPGITRLAGRLAEILPDGHRAELARREAGLNGRGVPSALASRVARLDFLLSAVDIVRLSIGSGHDVVELGRRFFAIGARFRLDALRSAARKLGGETEWKKAAAAALIEDLYAHQADLTARAMERNGDFDHWLESHARDLDRLDVLVREIEASPQPDLAMLTVANRALKGFLLG